MTFSEKLNNFIQNTKMRFVEYAYIIAPLIGLFVYIVFLKDRVIDINLISNIINLSGTLAGFLFASLGIMIALPDNQFTLLLKENGYMNIIYKTMTIGIVAFLLSMVVGLFELNNSLMLIFFTIGVSETFLSSYYLYRVSYYTNKSI